MEGLTEMIVKLNITSQTSRNAAHKTKKAQEEELHSCAVCFHIFPSHNLLVKHIKNVHKANSQEICAEYKDACAALEKSPEDFCAHHNKKISLMKVTMLEKYKL